MGPTGMGGSLEPCSVCWAIRISLEIPVLFLLFFLDFVLRQPHYVAQVGFELVAIVLFQPLKCRDYKSILPCLTILRNFVTGFSTNCQFGFEGTEIPV